MKTRGQLESEISEAVIALEKEFMGRGHLEARSHLFDHMVLVRLKSVLTPVEIKLAETDDPRHRRDLIKQLRMGPLELGRLMLETAILELAGRPVESLHSDISMRTGERIIVFALRGRPQCQEKGQAWISSRKGLIVRRIRPRTNA